MTRESLNKHWEVIDAWRKGAEVECYKYNKWISVDEPSWYNDYEYRVKSTPEYIPFDFTDAEFLIGKLIKSKVSDWVCIINACTFEKCWSGDTAYAYKILLNSFTFLDGSPCGKLK